MTTPLSSTIVALIDSMLTAAAEGTGLAVRSVQADLPTEASIARTAQGDPAILLGPPTWRWRTDFDRRPGRLRFSVDVIPTEVVAP